MRSTGSGDFKVKTFRPSSSLNKKMPELKSQTIEQKQTSVQRLPEPEEVSYSSQNNLKKPPRRPSTGRRLPSSKTTSLPAQESQQVETALNTQQIVSKIVTRSHKIMEFVQENAIPQEQLNSKLYDQLFLISLAAFIKKNELSIEQSDSVKRLERYVLQKLTNDLELQKQSTKCERQEQQILSMIEERLHKLNSM